ncbi:trypsin alpha-3-like [Eriocheir sinensis]|uniref:trypsin alpha-3-like n=1 Tax=Eriocheir sinensis TaxID=95602 RepID=UPI0021C82532|nr:trypsin alpha-3-like [Eriocheir sinensis]
MFNIPTGSLPADCSKPQIEARIYGGVEVTRNGVPSVVGVRGQLRGSKVLCGGVLITPKHVITSAHCVFMPLFAWVAAVILGGHTHEDGVEVLISYIAIHPDFAMDATFDADLAVLTLAAEVTGGIGAAPACITPHAPPAYTPATVYGWGRLGYTKPLSAVLRQADVKILPPKYCRGFGGNFTSRMLCAGDLGRDACTGDSGGPLMGKVEGEEGMVVFGLVSFGHGCGMKEFPGGYTSLAPFREWITSVLY